MPGLGGDNLDQFFVDVVKATEATEATEVGWVEVTRPNITMQARHPRSSRGTACRARKALIDNDPVADWETWQIGEVLKTKVKKVKETKLTAFISHLSHE